MGGRTGKVNVQEQKAGDVVARVCESAAFGCLFFSVLRMMVKFPV